MKVKPEERQREWYRKHGYVEHAEYSSAYILPKPFRKAFQDLTENSSPTEVPRRNSRYKGYTEEKKGCIRVQLWSTILSRRHGLIAFRLPRAHGGVKCPVCGKEAEGYTMVGLVNVKNPLESDYPLKGTTVKVYRHPNGKPAPKNRRTPRPAHTTSPGSDTTTMSRGTLS